MRPGLRVLHQAHAGARADAAGLREFAANAVGCVVRDHLSGVDSLAGWRLGELHLLDLERLKPQAVGPRITGSHFVDGLGTVAWLLVQGHGDVDVLEDAAWGDAEDTDGGFDEVVAFASAMLAAEMVDEAETGTELFGFD